jgi:hypothetical protein
VRDTELCRVLAFLEVVPVPAGYYNNLKQGLFCADVRRRSNVKLEGDGEGTPECFGSGFGDNEAEVESCCVS